MNALYHYCSSKTLKSILENKAIWLSSLNLSNDTLEGRLISEIIFRIAKNEGLDSNSLEKLQDGVSFLEQLYDGLAFCLSENGDLLSQWRGYASDATGFSIGFSVDYLKALTDELQDIHGKQDFQP